MKKVQILQERRLVDDYFKVDEALFAFERFDGTMSAAARRLVYERGDSAAAIVFHRETQRVLLMEQFRFPTYRKGPGWTLETVAGIVAAGEGPEQTVRREVMEEIGYEIERLHLIARFYPSPGGSSERITLYCAEVSSAGRREPGGGVAEEGEDIRVAEHTIEALRQLLAQGLIHDAKTLIGVQWLLGPGLSTMTGPGGER